jgi:DNA (cytosine-5)-methyltransferase 1
MTLYDHEATGLSELDLAMIRAVPPGGNWQDVPESIPSRRLEQIRASARKRGGIVRTTYYGRLEWSRPSYTISTYFNRPGNGCNIHPEQDRTLSIREAARLQSFPDTVQFEGSQAARRRQVGNAVPPLLGRAVGSVFPEVKAVDLFAGAGGLSFGLSLAGHQVLLGNDNDGDALTVHRRLLPSAKVTLGDITNRKIADEIIAAAKRADLVVGGPPCQGWSFAGWHNKSDPRNRLVWSFIDVLRAASPEYFVIENVQGLAWMGKGKAMEAIKQELRNAGYGVTHWVLNAADFGVPQRRKRVFIVGSRTERLPDPPAPMFTAEVQDFFLPPHRTVKDAISDLPPLEPGGGTRRASWTPEGLRSGYAEWCNGKRTFDAVYEQSMQVLSMG